MHTSKTIAVIGGGPAGLTAAYCLSKKGFSPEVFEAAPFTGGMCRTISLWGQNVDLGPHRFFSADARINDLWLEVVGKDYRMVDRLTRIYYRGRFFQYPLKPVDALRKLGALEVVRSMESYFRTKLSPPANDDSFEYWVTSRFGKRLFDIFFKAYSEKLWGISCRDLDADFAAQRIKNFSLSEAVLHTVRRSSNKHKTLVSLFAYPTGGTGMVYDKMEASIRKMGGHVHLSSPVQRIIQGDSGRAVGLELANGTIREFDHIISSMPLTHMVRQLEHAPVIVKENASQLRFRNTILVYLKVDSDRLFPDNWLYIQEPSVQMGRITNFRNWVPELYGAQNDSILAIEYWCNDEDALWTASDQYLSDLASKELKQTGLLQGHQVTDSYIHRVSRCYPIYRKGYKTLLDPITNYLKTVQGLSCIGRYGAFKYNNQDHSILMGILAAENMAHGAAHDLWQVNTDYEAYQEESRISETGLDM